MSESPSKRVHHWRPKGNPDHARRDCVPSPSDAEIEQRLTELVKPAVFAELEHYHRLGRRNRLLNLPVMVALVLSLLWRRVPGVCALQRLLARERLLWSAPLQVSQPALAERFLTFPAELFEAVLGRVLEQLPTRQTARTRPLPPGLQAVAGRFAGLFALDGTTLEALFRKLHALQDVSGVPLAGHLGVLFDLLSHVPRRIWYAEEPLRNERTFVPQALASLPRHSLTVFDLGYFGFAFFDQLTAAECWFVTRLRAKTSLTVQQVWRDEPQVRDRIVQLGRYRSNPSVQPVRLVEIQRRGVWLQYVTNVLDPAQLSMLEIVRLYAARWRIETAFLLVKRLLDLAYLWVGSLNGVQLQVWATWLYYAVLVDLCDDVADALGLPLERISVEMVSRGLYHYVQATAGGYASSAVHYFADPVNRDLGIVKRPRPARRTLYDELEAILTAPPRSAPLVASAS